MIEVVPILRVRDARGSAAFYAHLGFAVEWEHQFEPGLPLFIAVRADDGGARLVRSEHRGDASPDTLVYVYVDDVDAVYGRLQQAGVVVHRPPEDMPWGVRELSLADPDGNRLRIGTLLG